MTAGEMSAILYSVVKQGLLKSYNLIRNLDDMSKQGGGYIRKK